MKKNSTLKHVWIMTAVYWVVGILSIFWGKLDHTFASQLKEINNIYVLVLIIILSLPLLLSLLLSVKVKMPRLICNQLVAVIYLLVVIATGVAYNLQNIIGYFFPIILFIIMALVAVFYALVRTFSSRKSGKYFFIDGKDKKECHDFWDAYKKYYVMGLTYGIIDGLITVIS